MAYLPSMFAWRWTEWAVGRGSDGRRQDVFVGGGGMVLAGPRGEQHVQSVPIHKDIDCGPEVSMSLGIL